MNRQSNQMRGQRRIHSIGALSRCAGIGLSAIIGMIAPLGGAAFSKQTSPPLVADADFQRFGEDVQSAPNSAPPPSPYASSWKCRARTACPPGFLRNPTGTFVGCKKIFQLPGCVGECQSCTGSANAVDLCVPGLPSDSCDFTGAGSYSPRASVNCGTITYYDDCEYFASAPSGEPWTTLNGCYCGGISRPSSDPCMVAPCIDAP